MTTRDSVGVAELDSNPMKSPPDIALSKLKSNHHKLFKDKEHFVPYSICSPISEMTNMATSNRVYLKLLHYLTGVFLLMSLIVALPRTGVNFTLFFKNSEEEKPVFFSDSSQLEQIYFILMYPITTVKDEYYSKVLSTDSPIKLNGNWASSN